MIDMHDKHKIHISCCPGFISKHKDIFVVSLSSLDTETTKWITALPDFLHPWHILWRINRSLCSMRKVLTTKDARGHSISSNGIGLDVLTWNILITTHRGSLHRHAISTRDIDYSQYQGCWWPSNASKVSTTRNYVSCIYVGSRHLFSWDILMKHNDLIIHHGQYHVCWWSDKPRGHAVWKR